MLECKQEKCGRMEVGRTDGQRPMVSDHNSSLSTLWSGELINTLDASQPLPQRKGHELFFKPFPIQDK